MNATAATGIDGTNGVIVRTTVRHFEQFDYGWMLLALLASALIAKALREVFWDKAQNRRD
jgi:hypothetical protein